MGLFNLLLLYNTIAFTVLSVANRGRSQPQVSGEMYFKEEASAGNPVLDPPRWGATAGKTGM